MTISRMRSGLFAGPVFIAAAITLAGAGTAQAACKDAVEAFDNAVKARAVDAAVSGLGAIGDELGMCLTRIEEFRARLVDFLIDYAGTPGVAAADRDRALGTAERTLLSSGNWKGKA